MGNIVTTFGKHSLPKCAMFRSRGKKLTNIYRFSVISHKLLRELKKINEMERALPSILNITWNLQFIRDTFPLTKALLNICGNIW